MGKQATQLCAALESLLTQMVALQGELLALLERKREAMRRANPRLMAELCALENAKVQALSELEKKRLQLVAQLTLLVDPKAKEPLRMADLAERLPEPARGRLIALRGQLRDRLEEVRRQTSVARRAADSLVRHVQGLVQGVTSATTAAAAYGRLGAPTRPLAMSTFSVTA